MSDIFREVDEEVRRSQAEAFWRRYSGVIFAICVLVVLAVAGWRFYDWRREQAAAAAGARFEAAMRLLQEGKAAEGEQALAALAADGSGIYQTLARFRAASETAKRDAPAAIRAFDALVADGGLDANLRDVARLRAAALAVDVETLAEVERRLAPLLNPASPWRHQAGELAAASAFKAGQLDKTRQYLDTIIIDRTAPQAIKSRAELLIGLARGAR